MKRNSMLDIIKGLCIIFIILDHYTQWGGLRLTLLFPYWITMAVPMLMIILGFQYAFSYERHDISNIKKAYQPRFVFEKFIRYSIPFWIAYILEFIISSISQGPGAIIWTWLKGLFTGGWGPGSYYYPILIQFIFLFPVIYFLIKKYDFVGLLICGFMNVFYECFQYAVHLDSSIYRLLIFRYILLIGYGCYIYLSHKKPKLLLSAFTCLIGGILIWLFSYYGYTPTIVSHWTQTSFFTALFIIPIMGLILRSAKLKELSCPPLELIGKASYNIFLVQMVYFNYVAARIYPIAKSLLLCNILNLCITILAGILFFYVEHKITHKILTQKTGC